MADRHATAATAAAGEGSQPYIRLISGDKQVFVVERRVALVSGLIKTMLETEVRSNSVSAGDCRVSAKPQFFDGAACILGAARRRPPTLSRNLRGSCRASGKAAKARLNFLISQHPSSKKVRECSVVWRSRQ